MTPSKAKATCYLLDVGQGTSQIIYLGSGRAIVIDAGPSSAVPLEFLNRYVTTIVAMIISHNDHDHLGGARLIMEQYGSSMGSLFILEDRPIEKTASKSWEEVLKLAEKLRRERNLHVERLESHADPKPIYEDAASGLTLDLLYPEFMENIMARRTGDANATCGVLVLNCGHRRVLFSGDATITAWEKIRERLGVAINCDVMTVPHHGGIIWDSDDARGRKELEWLYSEAIRADYAVISVGTHNTYDHPKKSVVEVLRSDPAHASRVLCTQITGRCCKADDTATLSALEVLRSLPKAGGSRGIPCAGTVVVYINRSEVLVDGLQGHDAWVEKLKGNSIGSPLCR